ncbi:MAG TPA: hypothetical protein VKE74_36380 [Gemmataceae bacterium]|nr:hypothetical protein [Gemmataceae bacterium]
MAPRLTVILSGMIAGDPHQGGATWAVLQYALGFRRLGHDVYFVEPVAAKALRPAGALAASDNAAYFRRVVADFGLADRAALLLAGARETVGLTHVELVRAAARADVLVNISGLLTDEAITGRVARRVYLDLDPAFNQFWHTQGVDVRFAGHTHFVTIALALGRPDCPVPTCGREWVTTVQPVVLEHWPVAGEVVHDALTTVGNWRAYGSVEHGGVFYGQKAHALRPLFDLPRRTDERFLLALAIHPGETKDLAALAENGWGLLDPARVAATPADYRRFVRGSRAEFGLAKSGYAAARCGWFSDRSVCYLASGRPVIAQETGFSRFLPTGKGLLAFETADDVLAGIEALRRDYAGHARAARGLAEEFFDSDKVLPRLLEQVGN